MKSENTNKIAVLGLGAMGSRMALRLLDAGYQISVYNRTVAGTVDLAARGARVGKTPREAASGCDVAIACVRDDDAARSVWLDPDHGALLALNGASIALDSSTLTPGCVMELAGAARQRDVDFLDAPVLGTRPQAESGQLVYFVGGELAALQRVRALLGVLGGQVHHVGESGRGATVKLAVNALFGIQVAGVAEILGFLSKAGIAPAVSTEILGGLPVTSPAAKLAGLLIAKGDHAPLFPIDLVEKDFGYLEQTAAQLSADVPTTTQVRELYARAKAEGAGELNISGIGTLF